MSTAGTANALWNTKVRSMFVPPVPERFRDAKPYAMTYEPTPPKDPVKRPSPKIVVGSD